MNNGKLFPPPPPAPPAESSTGDGSIEGPFGKIEGGRVMRCAVLTFQLAGSLVMFGLMAWVVIWIVASLVRAFFASGPWELILGIAVFGFAGYVLGRASR